MTRSSGTDLRAQAATLLPAIARCHADYLQGTLRDYDLVGIYIALHLAEAAVPHSQRLCEYPEVLAVLDPSYLLKIFKKKTSEQLEAITVMDIFRDQRFVGIKCNADNYVNFSMVMWSYGRRPVRLLTYIPSPMEVLRQQARGERVVTIFTTLDELGRQHTSKLTYMDGMPEHDRDPLEFTIHDLKHMEFYTRPDICDEQRGFFRAMLSINAGKPKEYFLRRGHDLQLWHELEYVVADMNCHCTHLLRYLYAKLQMSCQRNFDSIAQAHPEGPFVDADALLLRVWRDALTDMGMRPSNGADGSAEADALAGAALDASLKLIEVSSMREASLTVVEWEGIRDYFKVRQ